VAFDRRVPSRRHNFWCHPHTWTRIRFGTPITAARYPGHTLLLIWPPYNRPMARHTLEHHRRAGGTRVAFVGEHDGGCCADDRFFALLDQHYDQVESIDIPQFYGSHDYLTTWRIRDAGK
jgi:hypothetical protein